MQTALAVLIGLWMPQTVSSQEAVFAPPQSRTTEGNTPNLGLRLSPSIVPPVPLRGTVNLDPKLLVQLLVARSPQIQYSRLQVEVAGYLRDAEAALYEGIFFGNLRRDDREKQRGIVERTSSLLTSNQAVLNERADSFEVGARNRLPTGGEVSLSYKLRDTRNNLISSTAAQEGEYDGSVIFTFKQPLLRGRGREVLETDRRIAEIEEKISALQYKQQMLKICNEALSVYWQFYRALEINRIRVQALENSRQILRDTGFRVEAGRVPASSVLEATAAAMIRDVERIRAEQGVREAEARLLTMLNISRIGENNLKLAAGQEFILSKPAAKSVEERFQQALKALPDYQIAKLRLEQGKFRLNFADNQRLPVLDLLLSRSNTGLAYQRDEVNSLMNSGRYPEWYVGLNIEVPIFGNQKANSQFQAQTTRIRQAELELEAVYNTLANDIQVRWKQVDAAHEEVQQVTKDVELRNRLLENERVRYETGLGLLAQLLQREGELNESRQRLVESNVRLGQAHAALMFADGSLLDEYGIFLKD